jgi:hypothetical protein
MDSSERLPLDEAIAWYLIDEFETSRVEAEKAVIVSPAYGVHAASSVDLAQWILHKLSRQMVSEGASPDEKSSSPPKSEFELPYWRYQFFRYLLER